MPKPQKTPVYLQGAVSREAERRERALAALMPVAPAVQSTPSAATSVVPATETRLAPPDEAVAIVEEKAGELFVAMVEQRQPLLAALASCGISSSTFFTALDASQAMRGWYRGVKAAQAVMDVEAVDEVLTQMDKDAGDGYLDASERTAKMTAKRARLEQARWAAQRLLPALFGEKTQHESHSKVEIIVRRETKKAVKAATEE